jgi:flagellar FliJ protein
MTKSQRMGPLTRVAGSRERSAARILGEQRRVLAEIEARLAELTAYREEYTRRLQQNGSSGIDVQQMCDFRVFLARLNEAIGYQQERVEQGRREYEIKRRQWFETRTRVKALDKVVQRYEQEERHVADQREQADTDERALQRHGRREQEPTD